MLDPTYECFYEVYKLGTQEFFIPLKELTKTDNIIQVDIIDNEYDTCSKTGFKNYSHSKC